jgi:hypothetical protein
MIMGCIGAHPGQGEEVTAMDDVDVDVGVGAGSVGGVSDLWERMSEK